MYTNMKKLNFLGMLTLSVMLVFAACKKDETSNPDPTPTPTPKPVPTPVVKMASLTGTWKATGTGIPEQDRNNYTSFELKVNPDSTCTWTKTHKSPSGTLIMEGNVLVEPSGEKDVNGKLIDRIWFSFNKINGENFSGSTHGIYQVDGNTLNLDWEFFQSGILFPDPAKGFGSGVSGQKSVAKYTR
jgi:hypothetical protein